MVVYKIKTVEQHDQAFDWYTTAELRSFSHLLALD